MSPLHFSGIRITNPYPFNKSAKTEISCQLICATDHTGTTTLRLTDLNHQDPAAESQEEPNYEKLSAHLDTRPVHAFEVQASDSTEEPALQQVIENYLQRLPYYQDITVEQVDNFTPSEKNG